MSYSSAWWRVRTSTDNPCPTSITTTSTSPGAGKWRSGHSNGSHNARASGLPGTPRGSNNQNAPSNANGSANQCASGSHHNANPLLASHSNSGQLRSKHHAAARHTSAPAPACSDSSPMPINDNGTTTRLHHGTAIRLANGPASDACPNRMALNGSSPTVATVCADTSIRNGLPVLRGRHHNNQATPRKLSQKPAPSTASGSNSNTTIADNASASAVRSGRRHTMAPATTAIISAVRTVGNAKPAIAV